MKYRLNVQVTASEDNETFLTDIANTLKGIAYMVEADQATGHGGGLDPDNLWSFSLEPLESHGDYIDGEGSLIHVDEDGEVVSRTRPDGTTDDTVDHMSLDAYLWGLEHGGMYRVPKSAPELANFTHKGGKYVLKHGENTMSYIVWQGERAMAGFHLGWRDGGHTPEQRQTAAKSALDRRKK